jgi:hypothetical protein
MDHDALQLIQDTAVRAADPATLVIRPLAEPPHVYYIRKPDGTFDRRETAPPREKAVALSVGAVAGWLKCEDMTPTVERLVKAGEGETAMMLAAASEASPEVWYSAAGVVGVSGDRTERITFALAPSEPFKLLADIAKYPDGKEYQQAELFRLLGTKFRDALPSHPDLRQKIGRVDINKAQQATGEISRKGVSVSRSLMAEAAGADQLPEVLTFEVPVFTDPYVPARARVRVAFDLDAQAERFRLCVLPGQMENAAAEGEAQVFKLVSEALEGLGLGEVPVYHGRPE